MSGHSKWSTIKRKKGEIDAARSKIFQKLAKELFVAAKSGDANPDSNAALRMVIEKAKSENMPNDNIARAIAKASNKNQSEDYEAIRYEGYGPSGVAFIVDCLTDNKNRTASMVRSSFTKAGGNLGTNGSVAYLFDRKGIIVIDKTIDEDTIMESVLDNGALDFIVNEDNYEIYTPFENFIKVKDGLIALGVKDFIASEITFVASNYVSTDEETEEKVLRLQETLEDIDDVQDVYHNLDM